MLESVTINVRKIANGVVVGFTVYSDDNRMTECEQTYFPTLGEAADHIRDSVVEAQRIGENMPEDAEPAF